MALNVDTLTAELRLVDNTAAGLSSFEKNMTGIGTASAQAGQQATDSLSKIEQAAQKTSVPLSALRDALKAAGGDFAKIDTTALLGIESTANRDTQAIKATDAAAQQLNATMRTLQQATSGGGGNGSGGGGALGTLFGGFDADAFGSVATRIIGQYFGIRAAIALVSDVDHAYVAFLESSISAYADHELALRRVTAALTAQGTATPAITADYQHLSQQFQNTTIYGRDLVSQMEALLVQVGNVMPQDMQRALQASTDLASGLGIDLRTATLLVGKAFEGHTETLARYGIVLDRTQIKAQGITYVLGELEKKFGGQAAAELDTYSGKVAQLANDWDQFKTTVGSIFVNDAVARQGLVDIHALLSDVNDTTKIGADSWVGWAKSLISSVQSAEPYLRLLVTLLPGGAGALGIHQGAVIGDIQSQVKGINPGPAAAFLPQGLPSLPNLLDATYVQQLKEARLAVAGLSSEELSEITAAKAVGATHKELTDLLDRFNTTGVNTDQMLAVLNSNLRDQKKAATEAESAHKAFEDSLIRVTADLDAAAAHHVSLNDQVKLFGPAASKAAADAKVWGESVKGEVTTVANAFNSAQFGKLIDEANNKLRTQAATVSKAFYTDLIKDSDMSFKEIQKASNDNLGVMTSAAADARKILDKTNNDTLAGRLAEIKDEGDALRAGLNVNGRDYQAALAQVDNWEHLAAQDATDAWKAHLDQVRAQANSYSNIFRNALKDIPGIIQSALTGGGGFAGGAESLVSSVGSKLGGKAFGDLAASESSTFASMFGIGVTSALGTILPGIGSAIGALAGPLIEKIAGFFHKPEYKNVMADVGTDWGVTISDALAKKIASSEATILGGTKEQRRQWAELLNISDIEKEAGGLTTENLQKFETQAQGLFEIIQRGGATGQQAVSTLNDQITQFAAQADKAGGLWDPVLKNLIAQSQALGLNLQSVTDAITAQESKLTGGVGKMVAGSFESTDKQFSALTNGLSTDQVTALADPKQSAALLKSLQDHGDTKGADQYQKAIQGVAGLASGSQDSFDRLSRIALNAFNTIVAGGTSAFDAITQLGSPIDQLIAEHDKLGLAGGAAFDQLSRLRTLTKDNQALVESVSGLNDAMTALANLGGLDANSFDDLQKQGESAFDALTKAGFTQQEAEQAMAPFLQNVLDLHQKTGLAIDDNTQALIDQATQDGVLKGQQISTNQILLDGLGAIIKAVGGDLPDSFKTFADKSTKNVDRVTKSIGEGLENAVSDIKIAPIQVPYYYDPQNAIPGQKDSGVPGGDTPTDAPGASTGALVTDMGLQYLAAGGPVEPVGAKLLQFRARGTDTVGAMLTPGEIVLNEAEQKNVASASQGVTINVGGINVEGSLIRESDLKTMLTAALAEAIAKGGPEVTKLLLAIKSKGLKVA